MTRLLQILKAVALASVAIVAVFLCVLLFQASAFLEHAQRQSTAVTGAAIDLLQKYDKVGSEASHLINDSRYSVSELNRNVLAERKLYETEAPLLLSNADGLISDVRTSTDALPPLLAEVTARTHDLAPLEANLSQATSDLDRSSVSTLLHFNATLGHADTVLSTTNTLLTDPAISATMQHVSAMTATGDHMLLTLDQVETKATHDYLHPSKNPFVRTWKGFEPFLLPTLQIGGAVAAGIK